MHEASRLFLLDDPLKTWIGLRVTTTSHPRSKTSF